MESVKCINPHQQAKKRQTIPQLEMSQPASTQPEPHHLQKVVLVCFDERKKELAFIDDEEGALCLMPQAR